MNIRFLSVFLLGAVSVSCLADSSNYTTVLITNKTDSDISVSQEKNGEFGTSKLAAIRIKPGKSDSHTFEIGQEPTIVFWKTEPEPAYVYSIGGESGKKREVQVVEDKKGLKLTSVPFSYNTIKNSDITFRKTTGIWRAQ